MSRDLSSFTVAFAVDEMCSSADASDRPARESACFLGFSDDPWVKRGVRD
jgi:hypothetical protein